MAIEYGKREPGFIIEDADYDILEVLVNNPNIVIRPGHPDNADSLAETLKRLEDLNRAGYVTLEQLPQAPVDGSEYGVSTFTITPSTRALFKVSNDFKNGLLDVNRALEAIKRDSDKITQTIREINKDNISPID